ncbi:hypothetical protein [Natronobeatus ordinarius]|uniref:hypothetical protein n=1 Tax=Natronobeatus ordinarius TaxID=2963433 RepID=UPI0020CFAC11|nr:hypothetical protein [Natronobeatus ordinarius]
MIAYAAVLTALGVLALASIVLEHNGYPVFNGLRRGLIILASIVPISVILLLWIVGFFQILNIDLIGAVGVDNHYEGYLRIHFVIVSMGLIPALIVAVKIIKTSVVGFRAVDSKTGETGVWKLPMETWRNMTVEDENGNELGKGALHSVPFYDIGVGYEADRYDEETNTAVTTEYPAGYKPSDIRHNNLHDPERGFQHVVDEIQHETTAAMDAAMDTLAAVDRLARESGAAEVNEAIRRREHGTLQTEGTPLAPIQEYLEGRYDRDERVEEQRNRNKTDPYQQDKADSESPTHVDGPDTEGEDT